MPNTIKPLVIDIVDAIIMTLRIFGNTADKFPVLLAGLIINITIKVALHHKREKTIWMPWISPPISLIKMGYDKYYPIKFLNVSRSIRLSISLFIIE